MKNIKNITIVLLSMLCLGCADTPVTSLDEAEFVPMARTVASIRKDRKELTEITGLRDRFDVIMLVENTRRESFPRGKKLSKTAASALRSLATLVDAASPSSKFNRISVAGLASSINTELEQAT